MAVGVALLDLPRMHPLLLWQPIIPATCLVFRQRGIEPPFRFVLAVEDVPGFGTDVLELLIDPTGMSTPVIERCQRTGFLGAVVNSSVVWYHLLVFVGREDAMSPTMKDLGIDRLSTEQRVALALEIWESLGDARPPGRLTAAQRIELTRRDAELEGNPGIALTWEQIRASVETKP